MANIQLTIPFKLRKRTCLIDSKRKSNLENEDYTNIKSLPQKRRVSKNTKTDNDLCSPRKIGRLNSITKELNEHFEDESIQEKTNNTPVKPLTSRENEIEFLERFLIDHLDNEKSASLYISGQPGTGKTASLSYILQLEKIREGYKQVYINCTMMKSAASIYSRFCSELQLKTSGVSEKACLSAIDKYFSKKHRMIYDSDEKFWNVAVNRSTIGVVGNDDTIYSIWEIMGWIPTSLLVLDEIDQLDSKRQSVLYTIFEWPARADTRIVLIGIANALDLTERTLPRLQARCSLRPQTLHFAPYTKQQIINIFTDVLAKEDRTNVFSAPALQMLAAKIAAVSGDMRRALDIGRRVIELARRSKFAQNQSVDTIMNDASVTVELKQVLEVLNDVYGGSRKIDADVEEGMPMQQKLILCSLLLMLTRGKNKEIVMGKLHDVYKKVAVSRNIAPLDMGEMCGACGLLESRGAVRVGGAGCAGGGASRARRLRLNWDEAELAAALADKPLLSAILADTACLS